MIDPIIQLTFLHLEEDTQWCQKIDTFLAPFERNHDINTFMLSDITGGEKVSTRLQQQLSKSDIVVVLISAKLIANNTYMDYVDMLLQRQEKGEVLIVPILLHACLWQLSPFGKMQLLPKDKIAISSSHWKSKVHEVLTEVALGIKEIVDKLKLKKRAIKHQNYVEKLEKSKYQHQHQAVNQLGNYPKARSFFTGRPKALKKFNNLLNTTHVFSIEGIGGIGKTEFAAKCIELYIDNTDCIIWQNGSSESRFDVFIEKAGYGAILKSTTNEQARFIALKDLIERDKCIIFIDNYQEIKDNAFHDFVQFAAPVLSQSYIILISRIRAKVTPYNIKLRGLGNYAIDFAEQFKKQNIYDLSNVTHQDIAHVCTSLNGHPLAIQLALQLLSYGETSDNILTKLVAYKGLSQIEDLSKRLLEDIFDHPETTQEEKTLLLQSSVYKGGVSREAMAHISGIVNINIPLFKLIDKEIIHTIISKQGTIYKLHPIIREFCYNKLKNKEQSHKRAASYLIKSRTQKIDVYKEKYIFYHLAQSKQYNEIVESILLNYDALNQLGQIDLAEEMLNTVLTQRYFNPMFDVFLAHIRLTRGNWKKAQKLYLKASKNTQDLEAKAFGAGGYGNLLHRQGNSQQGLKYVEEAIALAKKEGLTDIETRMLNAKASIYKDLGLYNQALVLHKQALGKYRIMSLKNGIADSLRHIGSVLRRQGQLNHALAYLEEALTYYNELQAQIGAAKTYSLIGKTLKDKGQFEQAMDMFTKSLNIDVQIGDKTGIAYCNYNIGNLRMEQGLYPEALSKLNESLHIFQEVGLKSGIASALQDISIVYINQGHMADAIISVGKAHEIFEEIGAQADMANALNLIGNAYSRQGKYRTAINKFQESLSIAKQIDCKSERGHALVNLANIYEKRKLLGSAMELATQGYEIFTDIGDMVGADRALKELGDIQHEQGQLKKSLNYHIQSYELRKKMQARNGIADTCLSIGRTLMITGKVAEGKQHFKEAKNIFTKIGNKVGLARVYLCEGEVLNNFGDYALALEKLQISYKSMQDFEDQILVLTEMGVAYKSIGQLNKAVKVYEEAISILKKNKNLRKKVEALNCLSEVYALKERFEEAKKNIATSTAINNKITNEQTPSNHNQYGEAHTLYHKGLILKLEGQLNAALKELTKGAAIQKNINAINDLVKSLVVIASIYAQQGKFDIALANYQQALSINRTVGNKVQIALLLNHIGALYFTKGNIDEAIQYYNESIELHLAIGKKNEFLKLLNNTAEILRVRGRYQEAYNKYEQALNEIQSNTNKDLESILLYNSAWILIKFNKYTAAKQRLQRAFALAAESGHRDSVGHIITELANIETIQEKFSEANTKYQYALQIAKDLNDTYLKAYIHFHVSRWHKANKQLSQAIVSCNMALSLYESIGNKEGTANCYHDLGVLYTHKDNTQADQAIRYFLMAIAYRIQMGIDPKQSIAQLISLGSNILGKKEYHHKLYTIHSQLPSDMQQYLELEAVIIKDKDSASISRNYLVNMVCPCGSGKLYTECHGI